MPEQKDETMYLGAAQPELPTHCVAMRASVYSNVVDASAFYSTVLAEFHEHAIWTEMLAVRASIGDDPEKEKAYLDKRQFVANKVMAILGKEYPSTYNQGTEARDFSYFEVTTNDVKGMVKQLHQADCTTCAWTTSGRFIVTLDNIMFPFRIKC